MDDVVDEGSALGGTALAVGIGAVVLAILQLPAAALEIGWIPGCLAWPAALIAITVGGASLLTESSPKGRRNAKRGVFLGVVAIGVQLLLVGVALWIFDQRFGDVFQSVGP